MMLDDELSKNYAIALKKMREKFERKILDLKK
jgi:hypothetical protein